jgi:hypothetical protein
MANEAEAPPTNQDEGFFPAMRLAKRPDYTAARNAAITEGIHTTLQFPLLCAIVCKLTTPIYGGLVRCLMKEKVFSSGC